MIRRARQALLGRGERNYMAQILPAGSAARGFTLNVTPDQSLSLSDLAGRPVILAFYPADWSPRLRRLNDTVQRDPFGVSQARSGAPGHIG